MGHPHAHSYLHAQRYQRTQYVLGEGDRVTTEGRQAGWVDHYDQKRGEGWIKMRGDSGRIYLEEAQLPEDRRGEMIPRRTNVTFDLLEDEHGRLSALNVEFLDEGE